MGILGKRALFETLRSIDSATFTGAYQLVGAVLANPCLILVINNNSGVGVTISFDGVHDEHFVLANTVSTLNFGTNAQSTAGDFRLALSAGTGIYVKAAANTGLVYITTVYAGG